MNDVPSPSFLALQSALAGRYALERELGRGGMGVVYLARDLSLDRPVAVKLLPPSLAAVPAHRERFLQEARTAARLSHPHIVPIHSVEEHGEFVLFVMGYVEGETLGQRIARGGPLSSTDAARILQEVAWALAYAHRHGVVHRDIKPDNILLERASGRALVSDFGIAQAADPALPATQGDIAGTARYMSPEQLAGKPLDGRSDLYSLGVTALSTLAPAMPDRLAPIIDRCLCPSPDDRFPDAEALADALEAVRGRQLVIPRPVERFVDLYKTLGTEISSYTAVLLVLGAEMVIARGVPIQSAIFTLLVTWGFFLTLGLAGLRHFQLIRRARRLLDEGYTAADVRHALEHAEEEKPRGRKRSPLRAFLWIIAGIVGAGFWVAGFHWQMLIELGTVLNGLILAVFTLGPVVVLRGVLTRVLRPQGKGWWSRLWWKVMEWKVFKPAGIGRAAPGIAASEPTEVMLGHGARELFDAMPAELRTRFRDLPQVLTRLEAQANRLRGTSADLGGDKLASTLAAMEHLRLDLLRLKVGAPGGDDLTSDLDAARKVSERIDALLDAFRELDARTPTPTPAT